MGFENIKTQRGPSRGQDRSSLFDRPAAMEMLTILRDGTFDIVTNKTMPEKKVTHGRNVPYGNPLLNPL